MKRNDAYLKLFLLLSLMAVVIHSDFSYFSVDAELLTPINPEEAIIARGGRLSVCSIGVHELELLPRIGSVTAERIIAARDTACGAENERIAAEELLLSVKGIGSK